MTSSSPSQWRKIFEILTPSERRRATTLLLFMILGAALEALGIGLVVPAIGVLLESDPVARYPALAPLIQALGNPPHGRLVTIGMLTLTGVYLFKAVYLAVLVWRQTDFTFSVQARLSERLFSAYLTQPYTFHLQRNSAELIRNAVTEVREFTVAAIHPLILLVTEGLVVVGISALLFVVQPAGALAVVTIMGVAVVVYHRLTREPIGRWGAARQLHDGYRIRYLQEGLGAAKDVKLLGREAEFLSRYRVHNDGSARAAGLHHTFLEFPRLGLELLAVLGLTVLVLTMLVQQDDMPSILPILGLFAAAAFRLMPSMNRVASAAHLLRYGRAAADTLYRETQLSPATPSSVATESLPFAQELAFRKVSYAYPGADDPSIRAVSVRIRRGEFVGIVGPSGSGKSTLVDLLLGLLSPISGEILVDGRDIRTNIRGWQSQLGYVPQTIYLTDDSIRRNIAFGVPDAEIDDDAVWRAVKAARLEDVVAERAEKLDAVLGERGVRLSGGQRQRLGIARALYHDPAVLVLDEATSALDMATEEEVMQAVTALRGEKTIVVVAHRLSTIARCDRWIRLEKGRLTGDGAPESDIREVEAAGVSRS